MVIMDLVDQVVYDDEGDLVLLRSKDTGQVLGHSGSSEPPLKEKKKKSDETSSL